MFNNYLKIASRILTRNYLYFIVNLIGLSLGIACCIVAYTNWEFHKNFDGQHLNSKRIYKVNTVRNFENQQINYGITPQPLVEFAKSEISEVKDAVRYNIYTEVLKLEDKVIRQEVAYVDPEFLNVFTFPLMKGSPASLHEVNNVYLTEEIAIQYYGTNDPLGKRLLLIANNGKEIELTVAGVIKDHPLNSSFKFGLLLNYETFKECHNISEEDWGEFTHASFLYLNNAADLKEVEYQLQKYISPVNESRDDWEAVSYYLVDLGDMANQARYIRSNYLGQNNPEGAIMIPNIMAIVILLVACFNFMNTSISLSGNRLKEIGVRKAIGASRKQLIIQLLSENIVIIIVSLGIGILLAEYLAPLYSQLGPWLDLKINYAGNIAFFTFLIVLLLLTAILSGAYPAFYVSRFNTSNIFNGRFRLKGSSNLSKGLMVLQLSFSLIALVQGIVYVQNTYLQKSFDLGYKKYGIITLPIEKGLDVDAYKEEIKTHSAILDAAVTNHHVGYGLALEMAEINSEQKEIRVFEVGENYPQTMEMNILKGRYFKEDSKTEIDESIIVNESFVNDFNLNDPVDQRVLLNDKPFHIIGVVKEFYPYGLWKSETDQPTIMKISRNEDLQFVIANVQGDMDEANQFMESKWKERFPTTPYESEYENIHVYRSELLSGNMGVLNIFLASIALFLSATGLFTLITINIQKRTKEIGVRRILGASIRQIVGLINKGFIWVVLVSVVFGAVMGAYLTEMFLDLMYSIHSHVGFIAIGSTTALIILIVTLTSGFKVVKAAGSPPVDALKHE